MPTLIEVALPDIGDVGEAVVSEISVVEGEQVAKDATLIVLESDKTAIEIPATAAGTVHSIGVAVGDTVSVGTVFALIAAAAPEEASQLVATYDESKSPTPAPPKLPVSSAPAGNPPATAAPTPIKKPPTAHLDFPPAPVLPPYATPEMYRYACQLGVDLAHVSGSGRAQRILREDVNDYVKQRLASPSAESPASAGQRSRAAPAAVDSTAEDAARRDAMDTRPLPRIKVISGQVLTRSWQTIPHVTHHDEADITALEAFRKAARAALEADSGVRLSLLSLIARALALTVMEYPLFNTALAADGQHLHWRQHVHIGIAVDTAEGLVVPVLRDVDQLRVRAIARTIAALSAKARDGKLKREEMQGAGITISSLGGIGGVAFTPIINPPQVAILGVSQAKTAPVWDQEACTFAPKLMLPLSLSYDHRVIDGAEAARFVVRLRHILSTAVATLD